MIDREIIRTLGEEEILDTLSADELKLYIIFLLFARRVQVKEKIDFATIKRAFGDNFTVGRLKNACGSLMQKAMVRVKFNEVKKESLANNNFINFTMEYELYALPCWQRIELRRKGGSEMEESKEDNLKWVCPGCNTAYYGWAKDTCPCPKCGYREEDTE